MKQFFTPTRAFLAALSLASLPACAQSLVISQRLAPAPPKQVPAAKPRTTPSKAAPKTVRPKVYPNTSQNPRLKSSRVVPKLPSPAKSSRGFKPRSPAVSGLGGKGIPRSPVRSVATGRDTRDPASAGLADQRLRANTTAPLLSLEDALSLTLANNPRLTEAQAAVNQATAGIGTVGAAGKLQVGLNGTSTYGRNTDASNAIANQQAASGSGTGGSTGGGSTGGGNTGGGAGNTATPEPSRRFLRADLLNVTASIPITTGGRVKASTQQARYNALAQIYQLAQVEQDLVLSTTIAYLDVLRNDQLLRVTNSNLAVSQERLRVAQVRFSVGASARLDVLRAQTDLADARSRRIQAANQLGTANASLNTLLGRSPDTPIRVVSISRLNLPSIPNTLLPRGLVPTPGRNLAGGTAGRTAASVAGNSGAGTGVAGTNGTSGRTGATGNAGATGGTGTVFSGPSIRGAASGGGTTSNSGTAANGGSGNPVSRPAPAGGGLVTTPGPGTTTGNAPSGVPGAAGSTLTTGTTATGTAPGVIPGAVGGATGTAGATGTSAISGATGAAGAAGTTATAGAGAGGGLQALAGSTRQSLAVTQAQIGAAEAAIEVAKSGKRPQLGLNLAALLRNPATFLGNFGASIGLGLAQNLFDSRRTRSQIDEARAALEQLKARLAGQRLEVANAIEASLLALDSSLQRQDSANTGVQSAREALRVAQLGFRSGVRTTLDLSTAQAALLAAETDAVNARFDVANSQATLAAAVGIYTVEAQNARERAILAEREAAEQARKQQEILQSKKKKRRKFLGIF